MREKPQKRWGGEYREKKDDVGTLSCHLADQHFSQSLICLLKKESHKILCLFWQLRCVIVVAVVVIITVVVVACLLTQPARTFNAPSENSVVVPSFPLLPSILSPFPHPHLPSPLISASLLSHLSSSVSSILSYLFCSTLTTSTPPCIPSLGWSFPSRCDRIQLPHVPGKT